MSHQRQVIGEKVVDLLVAGATAAGSNVWLNRVTPLRSKEIPGILVYALSERSDDEDSAPRELRRTLSLEIEVVVLMDDAALSTVNDLAAEIEAVMDAARTLDGKASDSTLTGTEVAADREGEQLLLSAVLSYDVTYYTAAPEPTANADLDDFERVQAEHNLGDAVAEGDAPVDEFTVEAPGES